MKRTPFQLLHMGVDLSCCNQWHRKHCTAVRRMDSTKQQQILETNIILSVKKAEAEKRMTSTTG